MDEEAQARGRKVRAEVLGEDHVARAMATADDFNGPFQELTHAYAWGGVWARPGLDRRIRSMLVLSMLIAQNRTEEIRLHIRGAQRNGVTRDELREVFLQAAVYCGMPAAVGAFRLAREVFAEAD